MSYLLAGNKPGRKWCVVLSAGVFVAAAAGCSSGSRGSAATGSTSSTAGKAGISTSNSSGKSPIVVGGITAAAEFPGVTEGFDARIARANRQGGVDGHPIKFIGSLDDGNSASTDLTDVTRLVLSDHVAVIAPVGTIAFGSDSGAFAASHQTPFLGLGTTAPFCGAANKWGWGFNGCLIGTQFYNSSLFAPVFKEMGGAESVKVAVVGNQTSLGLSGQAFYGNTAKLLGAKVVLNTADVPLTGVTDYSPFVTQILSSHANLVVYGVSLSQSIALQGALRAAGYTGHGVDYQSYTPGLLAKNPAQAAAQQGEYIDVQVPPQESDTPAIKQALSDMVAIHQPQSLSVGNQWGYWSADIVVSMLQNAAKDGRPLTGAGLEAMVNSGYTYTGSLPGGIGPNTFTQSENAAVPCAALVQVVGTEYRVVQPMSCYDNIKVP